MSDKQVVEQSDGWLHALLSRWRASRNPALQRDTDRELEIRDLTERLKELEAMVGDLRGVWEAEKKMERWIDRWERPEDCAIEEDDG